MAPEASSWTFIVGFRRIEDVVEAPDPNFAEAAAGDDPTPIQIERPNLALVTTQDPEAVGSDQFILEPE